MPATVDDAVAIVTGFPEVTEGARFGNRTWFVGGTSRRTKPQWLT
jgi:hypothetical protein